ncbi:ROK family protein [Litorilinea aerophila]|uniref:ROK family protein n=1 Tax=Litorilinea aerophila TaxID=1204385 RepID=A0A540VEJ2_9CHLR|nr:ROK family protein [Litorilinea aerophila]MCC9077143.1 ROK family protein [Litorilinea aerophila]
MNQRAGQPELLKEINRARLFDELKAARVLSRPELAQRTGLSRAAVTVLMEDLIKVGVARESGLGNSTGGRPPVLLEFNPDAAYAIGARMRDSQWGIVMTNLDAQVIHSLDVPIPNSTPEAAVRSLCDGVRALMAQVHEAQILPALGVGTPGLVDMSTGVIKSAVDVGWFEVPFRDMVEEELGMRTFVANRSKVGALAELWCDPQPGITEIIYISIGTGIAAGIVHENKLYIGANSSAGELGHVTVLPDGPLCPCGNRGCLQQLASGPAIANRARAALRSAEDSFLRALTGDHPERLTASTVFMAAEAGDPIAQQVVLETAQYLGLAIANLINLFNPQLIVIGGPVGQEGRILLDPLRAEVQRRAMAYPLSALEIVMSNLGQYAGAIGAAVLVLQHASELIFARH